MTPRLPYRDRIGIVDLAVGRPETVSQAVAAERAAAGDVVVYFRDGCPFCARLRMALRRHRGTVTWVDIWADDDARAFVASVNGGNETVPTVVVDGEPHTSPPPSQVLAALRG
ncbi:MAG: glutaredoxin domain-containing protein [Phycicoccus sp.]